MQEYNNTTLSNLLHKTSLCEALSVSDSWDVASLWGYNSQQRWQNSCVVMDILQVYTSANLLSCTAEQYTTLHNTTPCYQIGFWIFKGMVIFPLHILYNVFIGDIDLMYKDMLCFLSPQFSFRTSYAFDSMQPHLNRLPQWRFNITEKM